jgi:ribonuclease HI
MSSRTIQSIYTDGACSGNPGPGGWATVIYFTDGSVHELGGADAATTNNRMEMQGAIAALEFLLTLDQSEPIHLYTDSEYVKNGITKWIQGWKKKGWKTSTGKPVLNQDLWELLDELNLRVKKHLNAPVEWRYVRGHTGNEGNERCDQIARAFSLGKKPVLRQLSFEPSVSKVLAAADVKPVKQTVEEGRSPQTLTLEQESSNSDADSVKNSSIDAIFDATATNGNISETIQSSCISADAVPSDPAMVDSIPPATSDIPDLPREVRVAQLRNLVETLHMADEVASQGYLITSSELADLMDVNASAVTSRGDNWVWRNWVVSRVRREGNQILWQLERVD